MDRQRRAMVKAVTIGCGVLLAYGGISATLLGAGRSPARPGDVVLETGFDTPRQRDAWSRSKTAHWAPGHHSATSLLVSVSAEQAGHANLVHLPLDLRPYRGCQLLLECMVKAEGVTRPPKGHLGIKFMLHYQSPATGPFWRNPSNIHGTFDWKPLKFLARIAPDATGGQLSLGLQESSGKVWFDQVRITIYKGPLPKRPPPPKNPGPVFKGHALPRLRGVMSPHTFRDEDLRVLGVEWNANVIRWQMTRNWGRSGTDRDLADYDRWLESELRDLDRVLQAASRYGLKVVVDMHTPPGGRYENMDLAIFHEPRYQDHYVAWWGKIARRYRGNPAVWGYDLVNEPVQNLPSPKGVADYLGAQVRAAKAIRQVDRDVPIFIEANRWDSADGFRELLPVDIPNVIYQVHMYLPGEFTHQGVHDRPTGVRYPGKIAGQYWDKRQIRKALAPVRQFQLAYNVHIFVGEFSAIRWAPGACDYLRDCIEVFEEYGWDWTYHAYREWDGWSVEHGSDRTSRDPAPMPTDRQKLLLRWFAKNQKPG